MTERPVIQAKALTKVYKLYDSPKQKFRDMLGLLRASSTIPEHHALDGIDLTINRGERVGIIGRNGAGKSTLLKLISGVLEPTSGTLEVEGSARALLEIGTGFHPDFTGVENVRAYLAQLGISGPSAAALLDEIVEFAELEEYIGQPLKTYSTGMAVRLMFATSTAVAPELLILDEVLGVGDAYFTRKSFDRIEEMCRRDGATLLLVSHDIYTSARLCERMIWLERGRVVFDGDPADAIKAYEESIREQEEQRLRTKSAIALARTRGSLVTHQTVTIELASPDGAPLPVAVDVAHLALVVDGEMIASLPIDAETMAVSDDDVAGRGILNLNEGCWGPLQVDANVSFRQFRNFGSPFHKAGGTLEVPDIRQHLGEGRLAVHVVLRAPAPANMVVRVFASGSLVSQVPIPTPSRDWSDQLVPLSPLGSPQTEFASTGQYGTGRLRLINARLRSGEGQETTVVRHGDPVCFEFDLTVVDPEIDERCDVIVALMQDGVDTACRFFTRDVVFTATWAPRTLCLEVPALRLGAGNYRVTLLIARNGYADQEAQQFYSFNPDLHASIRDVLEFKVVAAGIVAVGTPWVADGSWSDHAAERAR